MNIPALLAAIALTFSGAASATQQRVSGAAEAIDGDSLKVAGVEIRLLGIDAPEGPQTCTKDGQIWECGREAATIMTNLVRGHTITCVSAKSDEHGRRLARCDRDGLDLGLTMVETGMAIAQDNGPHEYLAAEGYRKSNRIGLWGSDFQHPKEWRAAHPELMPVEVATPQPKPRVTAAPRPERVYRGRFGCAIKGNRSRRGDWIYHLPGMPYYERTRPEELFCTESEARRAGYRRSKA